MPKVTTDNAVTCFHCGEDCVGTPVNAYDKNFCCDGCKMVYEILNENGLCDYYNMSTNPGVNQRVKVRDNKFAFLEEDTIARSLISYTDDNQTHITFYLPQIHCSSCLWLLENLHKINEAVISSKVNFARKEVDLIFDHNKISTRKVAELLTSIGYEPYISLQHLSDKKKYTNKEKIYKLGIAGFCFANIMLLSFPEYLGIDNREENLIHLFRYLNVLLSLPVVFYSASEFYKSAWKSIKHGFLNIDMPIVLAIVVTFIRSLYEVFSHTGGGYFDSMSGIVFFMLVGRVLQDRTYEQLNFERDYTSYFPIAVSRIKKEQEETVALPDIQLNDTLRIHSQELIPADGILTRGKALIDYSFVTGESLPVEKEMGEIVYAGGKQLAGSIEVMVIKEVTQSYLTKLWNRDELKNEQKSEERSFVHFLSRYFTLIVLIIAFGAGAYWFFADSSVMWNAFAAVLIVACPCALLLSNTFTNGNILRILSRNHFYLKNAVAIEDVANVSYIVFDKTGTLTTTSYHDLHYDGKPLTPDLKRKIAILASQSSHPMSRAIATRLGDKNMAEEIIAFNEKVGYGIEGIVEGDLITLGSATYVAGQNEDEVSSSVYIGVEGKVLGRFTFHNQYRKNIQSLIKKLQKEYPVAILSGDNEGEKDYLRKLLGEKALILFHQKPEDKLLFIKQLQQHGQKVMMIGDGLNDAGALKQANVGVSVTEDCNNFTPASNAILEAGNLLKLNRFIRFCKLNKTIVLIAFIISIMYNIVGIYFSVTGKLSPMIAAILMPCSSISIVLITFGMSSLFGRRISR
jgi:Cu+-exporting ATPase